MKRLIALILALLGTVAYAGSTPPIVLRYRVVTNEAEFRSAALAASTQPAFTIAVQGRIELTQLIAIHGDRTALVGTDATAEVVWTGKYDCNSWQQSPWMCVEFYAPSVSVHGIVFRGMERGALKWQANPDIARFWSITNCGFDKVAVIPCLPKVGGATAENAPYGQCISGHGMYQASITINGCHFNECDLSALYWSHGAYLSAANICMTSNTFFGCGNPFGLGGGTMKDGSPFRSNILVAGNLVIATPEGRPPDPTGIKRAPFLYSFGQKDAATVVGNTYYGSFAYPYTGQPYDSGMNLVGWNNWRFAKVESKAGDGSTLMGADTKVGRYIDFNEWKQFETGSLWP